ncbi:hypothetical protein [Planococcus sp. CAU13]|uniref:hypothetical protein n=1 Tax=Planococcus sp. CAU13 TaxID=1541197 RepID=UPI00053001E7|nr:hypothetical protein [Planococcus sp. CAU13]
MKLPNGVTGFYRAEDGVPPSVNRKQFKQLCLDLASRSAGKVISVSPPQYPANFYCAQVELSGELIYILLNEHYPYLAFASSVEFGDITFIDVPALHALFDPFYQVTGTAELNVPVNQRLLMEMELNRAETEQIAYWKPGTVGQIIFNHWD